MQIVTDDNPASVAVHTFIEIKKALKKQGEDASDATALALTRAAATFAVAQHTLSLAETVGGLEDSLRTDHPLQAQTFSGLTEALGEIAAAIRDAAPTA